MMNHTFAGAFMKQGNRFFKSVSRFSRGFFSDSGLYIFDNAFDLGFISDISFATGLILSGPFKGGWMIGQILISFYSNK
jgi:hypothetical protein